MDWDAPPQQAYDNRRTREPDTCWYRDWAAGSSPATGDSIEWYEGGEPAWAVPQPRPAPRRPAAPQAFLPPIGPAVQRRGRPGRWPTSALPSLGRPQLMPGRATPASTTPRPTSSWVPTGAAGSAAVPHPFIPASAPDVPFEPPRRHLHDVPAAPGRRRGPAATVVIIACLAAVVLTLLALTL